MRSSRPSVISRTPRLRDASRRTLRSTGTRRRLPARATNRHLPRPCLDRPRQTPAAHHARRDRTAHGARRLRPPQHISSPCEPTRKPPGPAFSEIATRLRSRQRARHRQRRGRARRARDHGPALDVAPRHAGLRLLPAVAPSRRSQRRDWLPTEPRDHGERLSDALPKGRPARTAGHRGPRHAEHPPLRQRR
jgi:hypothetical protein